MFGVSQLSAHYTNIIYASPVCRPWYGKYKGFAVHKTLMFGKHKGVRDPKSLMFGKPLMFAAHKPLMGGKHLMFAAHKRLMGGKPLILAVPKVYTLIFMFFCYKMLRIKF